MYLDRLAFKKDPLRFFDGRCRLLAAALVILAAAGITNPAILCAVALALLAALFRELGVALRRLLPVNLMACALWLPVVAGFSPRSALLYTLRINCAALAYMCFLAPMGISRIASSMTALRTPEKLVALFILTHRYIFLLSGGLATALVSMRSRLPENTALRHWRSLGAVFAASLVRAACRAERVGVAMSSRGFEGSFPATLSFRWRIRDSVLLAACAGFFAAVTWLV
jgi:energy-coupling factor transporter transmembrane protein EcfT